MFKFNPNVKDFKSLTGAVDTDKKFNIAVLSDSKKVVFLIAKDGGEYKKYSMTYNKSKGMFCVSLKNLSCGLYFYRFETEEGLYGQGGGLWAKKATKNNCVDYQLTVTESGYVTPDILKGAVIYQIFPDRFCRGGAETVEEGKILCEDWFKTPTYRNSDGKVLNNEFYGGDFKGIRSKLDYLKSLGVSVVYLNPISKAYSSHRYDTGDYLKPDRLLGSEDDLKSLIKEGEKVGISFVFDGVYNHTGADSRYFNKYSTYDDVGAYNSVDSPYYDWYSFYDYPNGYNAWWNFKNLPSIKKDSQSFQTFILEKVLPYYFEMGFKGVRLDVVDELTDDFVEKIRQVAKRYGAAVIGEVWEDATNKIAYGVRRKYFLGKELDSVMNYRLRDGICDFLMNKKTDYFVNVIQSQKNNYPKCALDGMMNLLSSHDTVRIINNLGREKVITDKDKLKDVVLSYEELFFGKLLAKAAYAILFTVYGSPSVYYGDEVAMTGDLDPYNRRTYPWGREDKDFLEYFKTLAKIRREESVFKEGELNFLYYDDKTVIYERVDETNRIVVAVTCATTKQKITFDAPFIDLLGDCGTKKNTFTLCFGEAKILKQIR